jgi:hypothetical protein
MPVSTTLGGSTHEAAWGSDNRQRPGVPADIDEAVTDRYSRRIVPSATTRPEPLTVTWPPVTLNWNRAAGAGVWHVIILRVNSGYAGPDAQGAGRGATTTPGEVIALARPGGNG